MTTLGLFAGPSILLRLLIAECPRWQQLRGCDTRDEAAKGIHVPLAPEVPEDQFVNELGIDEGASIYPRCEITTIGQQMSRRKQGISNWVTSGNLLATIDIEIPEKHAFSEESQFTWFGDQIGNLICEMEDRAGEGESLEGMTHLNVIEISIENFDHQPQEAERHETIQRGERSIYPGPRRELWWASLQVEYF